jgi:hypothetical protein
MTEYALRAAYPGPREQMVGSVVDVEGVRTFHMRVYGPTWHRITCSPTGLDAAVLRHLLADDVERFDFVDQHKMYLRAPLQVFADNAIKRIDRGLERLYLPREWWTEIAPYSVTKEWYVEDEITVPVRYWVDDDGYKSSSLQQ